MISQHVQWVQQITRNAYILLMASSISEIWSFSWFHCSGFREIPKRDLRQIIKACLRAQLQTIENIIHSFFSRSCCSFSDKCVPYVYHQNFGCDYLFSPVSSLHLGSSSTLWCQWGLYLWSPWRWHISSSQSVGSKLTVITLKVLTKKSICNALILHYSN